MGAADKVLVKTVVFLLIVLKIYPTRVLVTVRLRLAVLGDDLRILVDFVAADNDVTICRAR